MRSFMVGDDCINRVMTWLIKQDNERELKMVLNVLDLEPEADRCKSAQVLGLAMKNLNNDALFARYGERDLFLTYPFKRKDTSDVQVLKSLACWLYQCSEGDVPERPLYLAMEEVRGIVAYDIVRKLPEWGQAKWG